MTEARLLSDEEIARSRPSRRRTSKASQDVSPTADQAPAPAPLEADQPTQPTATSAVAKPRVRRTKAAAAAPASADAVPEPAIALSAAPAPTPSEPASADASTAPRPSRARASRKAGAASAPVAALQDTPAPESPAPAPAATSDATPVKAAPRSRAKRPTATSSSAGETSAGSRVDVAPAPAETRPTLAAAAMDVAASEPRQEPAPPATSARPARRVGKRSAPEAGSDAAAPGAAAQAIHQEAAAEPLVAAAAEPTPAAPPELAVTPAPVAATVAPRGRNGRFGRRAQQAAEPRIASSTPGVAEDSGIVAPAALLQTDAPAATTPDLSEEIAPPAAGTAPQQQNGGSYPGRFPAQNGSRPAAFRQQPGQQGRASNGIRPQQPFSGRPPQNGAAPLDGPGDYANGQDPRQNRRRRRRRGRNGLQAGPAPVQGPAPLTTQRPSGTVYAEERQPLDFAQQRMPVFEVHGMLDFLPNQEAFLREEDLRHRSDDSLIGVRDTRRFDLRNGDIVSMEVRPARGRGPVTVERVISVNGLPFEELRSRPRFEDLTAVYPDRMIKLETGQQPLTTRMIDMIAPVGFGQRALIVSPPKAGKTTLLKNIGQGVTANYPNAEVILCLVGERPEEVTDMRMSLPRATMFASSFDEDVERHGHLCEMALERAKRLAEQGKDVVVLLDSITRLARAYNLGPGGGGGRTLSGGMDASALTTARKIFGAARAIEQGGSLTIIATCLVDTGSRLDDVVYEEFKGTGNMELHLDRGLAERRIFPAIDIGRSSTRKEELLLDPTTLRFVVLLRRRLAGAQTNYQATENLIERLAQTPSNRAFLELLSRASS